jgi:transcriptional regulator with XRE-family HTH domain
VNETEQEPGTALIEAEMSVVRPDELGELIRTRRQAQRMTQAQLGAAIGARLGRSISDAVVGHWERGRRMPTDWKTIGAIGGGLGVAFVLGANARVVVAASVGTGAAALVLASRAELEAQAPGSMSSIEELS